MENKFKEGDQVTMNPGCSLREVLAGPPQVGAIVGVSDESKKYLVHYCGGTGAGVHLLLSERDISHYQPQTFFSKFCN